MDLKYECREAIDKFKVKPHFCKFHVKQVLNMVFKDYFAKICYLVKKKIF